MAPDSELAKQRERKLASRRYLSYRCFNYGLYFCLFITVMALFGSHLPDGDWSRAIAVGLLVGVFLFVSEWISALVYKRKFRPRLWGPLHDREGSGK